MIRANKNRGNIWSKGLCSTELALNANWGLLSLFMCQASRADRESSVCLSSQIK